MDQISFCNTRKKDIEKAAVAIGEASERIVKKCAYSGLNGRLSHFVTHSALTAVSLYGFKFAVITDSPLIYCASFSICLVMTMVCGVSALSALAGAGTISQEMIAEKILGKHKDIAGMKTNLDELLKRMQGIQSAAEISNHYEKAWDIAGAKATIKCEYAKDPDEEDGKDKEIAIITVSTPQTEEARDIGSIARVIKKRVEKEKKWKIERWVAEKLFHDDYVDFGWIDGEAREAEQEARMLLSTCAQEHPKIAGKEVLCLPETA